MSDENLDDGNTASFPKLKDCGGFELLHCIANCRNLENIGCDISSSTLKSSIGKGKIYIRPIQKSLSQLPINIEKQSGNLKETCSTCKKELLIQDLRGHLNICCPELNYGEEDFDESLLHLSPFDRRYLSDDDNDNTQEHHVNVQEHNGNAQEYSPSELNPMNNNILSTITPVTVCSR